MQSNAAEQQHIKNAADVARRLALNVPAAAHIAAAVENHQARLGQARG